jgi:hypothetical protein
MKKLIKNWEYDVLGIDNYKLEGKFSAYYNFIKENHNKIEGDIAEVGVYKGKSLLATALLLKEIGSKKIVYGFDSFSGFPPILSENDKLSKFKDLYDQNLITKDHLDNHNQLIEFNKLISKNKINELNISTSNDFSDANLNLLKEKIKYLNLDNIILIEGDFDKTMTQDFTKTNNFMASMFDCDLYESYKISFEFIWPRLADGGLIFLDEYYSLKFPGAKIATDEFLNNRGLKAEMLELKRNEFERWIIKK